MNCKNCGKYTKKDFNFCTNICEDIHTKMLNTTNKPIFRTYQEAGLYLNKDFRTAKKYENILFEINKTLPSASTKWVCCKICGENSPKSKARHGYCKTCTFLGLGKKEQGKKISKKYKGQNNPNYLHGKSVKNEYQTNTWYNLKKELNYTKCLITGIENNIDYHHIIPRWFCKLVGISPFDKNNIIGLNTDYHKVIHHLKLDILLLPILYPLYKKDAHLLLPEFVRLCLLHKVPEFPLTQLQSLSLFQVSRYPGKKKLLSLLPEFLEPFLSYKEC